MTALATPVGLAGLWFDGQAHHPGPLNVPLDPHHPPHHPHLRAAGEWLDHYWQQHPAHPIEGLESPAGRTHPTPPLDLQGTEFQRAVWAALRRIAPGATTTYGALARTVGSAQAVRAVGAAVGRNPVSLIVPCHRVLGQGGHLTGYAGGLDRKARLLAHEGVTAPIKAHSA
jgi:methylated-DNA-[protein]-cysteine S-methyltransferase